MIAEQDKESIYLWLGSQSKNLSYTYYNLTSEQIFDQLEDPINQHTIYKNLNKRNPRALIFDIKIDRLVKLRQVNHSKMISKIKNSGNKYSVGLQNYFGNVDISSMMSYGSQTIKQKNQQQLQEWGEFENWTDSQKNYVLIDHNFSHLEMDTQKNISTQAFIMAYEHHQQYYRNNKQNIENKIRKQLEQCDYLKYMALNTDQIFAGFTINMLQYLSDTCPKLSKALIEIACPHKQIQFSLPSFAQMYDLADIYLPICSPLYPTFQLVQPQKYSKECNMRMSKNINISSVVNMFYAPFNMRNGNIDNYLANLTGCNRKLFNAAYTIPIIRADNELGPHKQQNQEKQRQQQGIFPYQKASRNLWDKKYNRKFNQKQEQRKYYIDFTNSDYLTIGPKGSFVSQSYIFKGHFNNFQKLLEPKCQNFSCKYYQGIFSVGSNPKLKYKQPCQDFPHNLIHHYSHQTQTIASYPYQTVLYGHQSFGNNIRNVLRNKIKPSKIFNQNVSEWKNRAIQIADYYQQQEINSEDDDI